LLCRTLRKIDNPVLYIVEANTRDRARFEQGEPIRVSDSLELNNIIDGGNSNGVGDLEFAEQNQNRIKIYLREVLLVLNLGLDVFNMVGRGDFECDALSGGCFNDSLKRIATNQVDGGFLPDGAVFDGHVVIGCAVVENQTYLRGWEMFYGRDLRFEALDGVVGFNLEDELFIVRSFD
jgi:hypothetical protein